MKLWSRWLVAGCLLLTACTIGHGTTTSIRNSTVPTIKSGPASFDVVEIDQKAQRLYAADRTDGGVDVFDVSTPAAKYLSTISLPAPPNGIAVAPDLGRVFAGQEDGSLAIIDGKTGTVLKEVPTGGKSVDLIDYSPERHEVFASNGADGTLARIDAVAGGVVALFKVGFALEQPRYNPGDRLLYVTSPDAAALFQLDPATGRVMQRISLGACQARGLAINPKQQQAVVACTDWALRVNLRNPADQTSFTQAGGGDVVTYDAAADRFLVAAPTPKASEVAILGGNPIDYVTAVTTGAMGNSAAYDEKSGLVYTPDVMPGKAGLASFALPDGELSISVSESALAALGALLAAIVGVMFALGRLGDPIRRPAPLPARDVAVAGSVRARARTWTRKA